ncbi:MAG: PFL family protein [Faecalibacterium sp.]|nr:PFL family protein [Faecalibacterium sp.]
MIRSGDILETIGMITQENLDVRTVTMGISLLDCIDPDPKKACEKIYNKITTKAANLVKVVEGISTDYGIPIINKRISVTPIAMLLGACPDADPVDFARTLDAAGKAVGVNFVGGYSALVHKGFSAGDVRLIESIPRALAETDIVCSSVNIGSTKSGLNMDAIRMMGYMVKKSAELTADRQCIGAAKLVVFCNAPEDNPFMAGAFHGPGEPDCEIHVGVSGPGAVRAALAKLPKDASIDQVAELVKRTAFKITRLGQLVANLASQQLGVPAGIIDLSLAPTPAVGDSVANILEEMGLEQCGCCGTTACLALLNDAVKKGGVMASNHVGGLSGAFIPVSEDEGMIRAAETGSLTIEKLEAMTAVCSVGLDMIIIPGDTTPEVISGLIADEAAIGMVNSKTTAVRVIPAIGRKAGEILDFGGLLGYGPIMPLNTRSPEVFINRGGRLPAPMQSLKN